MPVSIDWLIEGRVIFQYWWGIGTLDDVHRVNAQTLAMYEQYPNQSNIHTIADSSDQDSVQSSISDIRGAYTGLDHPQTGWILLIVNNNSVVRLIGNIILRISPVKFQLFRNLTDSLNALERIDPTINLNHINHAVIKRKETADH